MIFAREGVPRNSVFNVLWLPTGFLTANPYNFRGGGFLCYTSYFGYASNTGLGDRIDFRQVINSLPGTAGESVLFNATWETNDPWPTTLPGTPA